MIEQTGDASQWVAYATRFGVPSFLAVGLYWIAPKAWAWIQQRNNINTQQNDLTQSGLSGVNEVVQTLRNQIGDMTTQLKSFEDKLKEMNATLEQAVQDKIIAQQSAEKAKNDLYILGLYVTRLQAQIKSLGAVPVEQ